MLSKPVDSICCNLALHYLWGSEEVTSHFLNNLLPCLLASGLIVVTFLDGDKICNRGSHKMFNEDKFPEFEVEALDEEVVNV